MNLFLDYQTKFIECLKNLKVNNKGILQLSEYQGSATAVIGGILYSGSNLFIGD